MIHRTAVLLALGLASVDPMFQLAAEDEFALGVRTTAPLSPAEQAAKFALPPGFEIQLVATEPDINKPMNLQFDATGRLWVTTSIEYPFPAPAGKPGRDRIMIFEDFGPDGRARKVTKFADGLNIPIGVYPFRTDEHHWKAIVWSIPNLWLLEDTDGDGVADKRTQLYGPFDHTRDTHGNQSSFRRGFDGWLYATHGFNNDSHVTARDGSHVDLNSGNTYRIRLDGSHIEQHTHGQVNPFGLAWDARGNLYSSDCHSAPIYQLLEGGYYPSFGKPHDGLGFAPVLMEHAHGSTAIDGALYYNDNLWPAEYQDNFFIGNVMTSRLNRDHLVFHGSSPQAIEQPDFLTTTDPWFRPVDNQLGPDGALYIADFYNRIIGHYEVPLTHPGRDRERGRIWRVVYRGKDGKPALRNPALAESLTGLIDELGTPSLTRRLLAMSEIQDRFGAHAVPSLRSALNAIRSRTSQDEANPAIWKHVHLLWLLERLDAGRDADLSYASEHPNSLVRTHAQRILAFRTQLPPELDRTALARLSDTNALVVRCAVEALGAHPNFTHLRPLLALQQRVPKDDTHLAYVVKKALRDHLRNNGVLQQVVDTTSPAWSDADLDSLLDVAVAVPSPGAATFLVRHLDRIAARGQGPLNDALLQAARHAPESELAGLAQFVRARFAAQSDFQLALFKSVDQGLQQRGVALPASLRDWGAALATEILVGTATQSADWANLPLEAAPTENPWDFQERSCSDGQKIRVLSSLARGEQLTGVLRSPEFQAGKSLSFWLCGHDGYPDKPAKRVNAVRLRQARTGAVLFEAAPPRNDVAQRVTWNTESAAGTPVVLEVADRDTGDAYAWLAIGGIEGGPALPATAPRAGADRLVGAAELASRLGLKTLTSGLAARVKDAGDPAARAAAARAYASLDPEAALPVLTALLNDDQQPEVLRERLGGTLAEMNAAPARAAVLSAMKSAPFRLQSRWAVALTGSRDGAEALLSAVSQGAASARLLQTTGLRNRLQAVKLPDWESRVAALTQDLAPANEARDRLIAERRAAYLAGAAAAKVDEGRRLFEQHCAPCHQIEGKGGLVGPQLTGVGNRGAERLCEDILDPNRNVDRAFRQTVITLKDGDVQSGLFRREEGDLLVFADGTGKEFSVRKGSVTERRESDQSLMPDNFGETLPAAPFNHLLAFLLTQRLAK
jgi:putative heme-binding domain-containing protein